MKPFLSFDLIHFPYSNSLSFCLYLSKMCFFFVFSLFINVMFFLLLLLSQLVYVIVCVIGVPPNHDPPPLVECFQFVK